MLLWVTRGSSAPGVHCRSGSPPRLLQAAAPAGLSRFPARKPTANAASATMTATARMEPKCRDRPGRIRLREEDSVHLEQRVGVCGRDPVLATVEHLDLPELDHHPASGDPIGYPERRPGAGVEGAETAHRRVGR